ncbi:MAG: hypothetical protein ACREOI_23630 [bacterium]
MLKRMFVFTILMIAALLLVNQVVIPHVRRSRGNDEMRLFRLQKGREIIARAVAAHGGLAAWQSKINMDFRMTDKWNSGAGAVAANWLDFWPARTVDTKQYYLLRQNTGRIELSTEAGRHVWGYSNLRPWALLNGQLDAENILRARSTVPAINYLFELPYKFLDKGAFPEFVNEVKHDGQIYDRVRITFGLNAGNYPPHNYVADFGQENGRLARLEYTVPEKTPGYVTFSADFSNYKEVDGVWIPAQVDFSMIEPLICLSLHQWQISEVRFNTGVDEKFFSPADLRLSDASQH